MEFEPGKVIYCDKYYDEFENVIAVVNKSDNHKIQCTVILSFNLNWKMGDNFIIFPNEHNFNLFKGKIIIEGFANRYGESISPSIDFENNN